MKKQALPMPDKQVWLSQSVDRTDKQVQTGISECMARLETVSNMTGLSKSSIYAAMAEGTFPRSVKLGKRAVGWRIGDIQAWLNSREQSGA